MNLDFNNETFLGKKKIALALADSAWNTDACWSTGDDNDVCRDYRLHAKNYLFVHHACRAWIGCPLVVSSLRL